MQADTLLRRDANGDGYINVLYAARGVRSAGHTYKHIVAVSGNITIDESTYNGTVYSVTCSAADLTMTLPAAASYTDKYLVFYKTDATAYKIIVDANASEAIENALTWNLTQQDDVLVIISNGTSWSILQRPQKIAASVAASTAITAASEGTFDTSGYTIPANTLRVGNTIEFDAMGKITTYSSGTDTIKFKLGTTVIASTGAITPAANDYFYIRGSIQIRTVGGSGTMLGGGTYVLGTAGTATAKQWALDSTTLDTTATQACNVTNTFSAASNSARLDLFNVKIV